MPASFPGSVKNFGSNLINGDYTDASQINDLRAEVVAIETEELAGDATILHAASGKAAPVDADELKLLDSASSFSLKKLTWANLKATLKAYFDGLYHPLSTISSGTYTAGLTNTTNIAASGVAGLFMFIRVGDIVHVAGAVTIDPTAAGLILLGISLPVASNFSVAANLAGSAHNSVDEVVRVQGDAANDRASLTGTVANAGNNTWYVNFTYRIM